MTAQLCLFFAQRPCARGTAVIAEIQPEGGKLFVVYLVRHTFRKFVIRAVFVGEIMLRYIEYLALIAALGKVQPQIDKIAHAALGVVLYFYKCFLYRSFKQSLCYLVIPDAKFHVVPLL